MGRKKGTPKTGGREKGTPNKSSLYIRNELASCETNLPAVYLKEVQALPPGATRIAALQWLFQFVVPKLKDIESPEDSADGEGPDSPPSESPAELTTEELTKLVSGKSE